MDRLIGCALIYATENKGVRLFAYYIFCSFASGIPLSLSLVSSNVAGYTKKATVSAMMFIAYCAGNIIGPFLFFSDEAPRYTVSFLTCPLIICDQLRRVRSLTTFFNENRVASCR